MGQNSTEVAYGFGQVGSAYTDKAVEIIPPKDHVIIAIQFLADSTPTVMTPERLDDGGPGYAGITGTTAATVLDFEETVTSNINFAGACGSNVSNGSYTAHNDITLASPPSDLNLIRVGQYVMIVDDGATENGSTAMAYDTSASGTPFPVYNGPHKAGVKVVAWDGVSKVKLDKDITMSGEALIFLDETHGAGGITSASQQYPKGAVIYGRWTTFKGEADKGVICYFGK
tara:strand:+ start:1427 stop:2113 length:687 start_codon:yes stop_codon:yes gene_type:complete